MIREMKRRHPLITIGQIQMRLQRTSNRVLSKASISRILTNSIRLGKRAKRSVDGEDDLDGMPVSGQDELMQLSSDENTGGGLFVDDTNDDDEDDETGMDEHSSLQNLADFRRFMVRKTSINGDDSSLVNEGLEQYNENEYTGNYPQYGSEDDDDEVNLPPSSPSLGSLTERFSSYRMKMKPPLLSIFDPKSLRLPRWRTVEFHAREAREARLVPSGSTPVLNENGCWNLSTSNGVKSEPVCVFVNRNYDENSSDSEHLQDQPLTIDEDTNRSTHQETPPT